MARKGRSESHLESSGGGARPSMARGVKLLRTLTADDGVVACIAFDPSGRMLASGGQSGSITLWQVENGHRTCTLETHDVGVTSVAFDPDGRILASGGTDGRARLWHVESGKLLHTLEGHRDTVVSVAFDSSGQTLTTVGIDGAVNLWQTSVGKLLQTYDQYINPISVEPILCAAFYPVGRILACGTVDRAFTMLHAESGALLRYRESFQASSVCSLEFSPGGHTLAIGSADGSIKLWKSTDDIPHLTLEGHLSGVEVMRFSPCGRLLASQDRDDTTRVWNSHSWETVALIPEKTHQDGLLPRALAFHPTLPLLATTGEEHYPSNDGGRGLIYIWELDLEVLLGKRDWLPFEERAAQHTTAKIVLVGDSGVGKTGLGWRLAHGEYREHDSTHGQQFWVLNQLAMTRSDGTQCEAVLWDLAGQPDYRLMHALSIQDADLALVLFDPTNSRDPLGSAEYWLGQLPPACPKILVAARVDRGHPVLTNDELDRFCVNQGIAGGWLATSAASGLGVTELLKRMKRAIPWDEKPAVSTNALFKRIKDLVLVLKQSNTRKRVIFSAAELRSALEDDAHGETFRSYPSTSMWAIKPPNLSDDQVLTAVRHLSSEGFVRLLTLSTGEQRILLAPELLNNLAASIVLEARRNPRGLGAVEESRLFDNSYRFRELESLSESDQALLLDGTITAFLENRLSYRCFRESWGPMSLLVFPDLMNLKKPDRDDLATEDGPSYVLTGSTENTFAGLVVLLGYTNLFLRTDQAKDIAWFESDGNELCGVRQIHDNDERTLVILFNQNVGSQVRTVFEGLVEQVLSRRDIHARRFRPVSCPHCRTRVEHAVIARRLKVGKTTVHCEECGGQVVLPPDEPLVMKSAERTTITRESAVAETRTRFEEVIYELLRLARAERRHAPMCFISYAWGNAAHERWVERRLAMDLEKAGITVVLDRWDNGHPGANTSRFLERVKIADRVLVIGTPAYRRKFDSKDPSTGTVVAAEIDLVSARLTGTSKQRETVVPLLLQGDPQKSLPSSVQGLVLSDFRDDDRYFDVALDLFLGLYGIESGHPAATHWKGMLADSQMRWRAVERVMYDDDDAPTNEQVMRDALKKVGRQSLNVAFATGQPVVVEQHGQLVWLHPDGTKLPYDGETGSQAGAK